MDNDISHDVIILGTQFQEKDLEIALAKVFDYGCDNSNFHYFFISPGDFKGKVADEINSKPNFHHIKWKTDEFLAFIDEQISQPKDAVQNICSQGITFWNKETQLGKLVNYADRRKDIINYIKQINDFIDVLYVAHHGKRFSEYFDSWMKLRDTDKQFPVFQSVTLLTTVGIPDISINYLPEMAASLKIYNFNYPQFFIEPLSNLRKQKMHLNTQKMLMDAKIIKLLIPQQ